MIFIKKSSCNEGFRVESPKLVQPGSYIHFESMLISLEGHITNILQSLTNPHYKFHHDIFSSRFRQNQLFQAPPSKSQHVPKKYQKILTSTLITPTFFYKIQWVAAPWVAPHSGSILGIL